MTYNLMIEFLKHQTRLVHSSYFVYEGHSLVSKSASSRYNTDALVHNNASFHDLVSSAQPINFYMEDQLFVVGAVKNLHTPYTIIIGPFRTGENVEFVAKDVYERHPDHFSSVEETQEALRSLPRLSLARLFNLLSTVFIALNQQPASLNSISSDSQIETLIDSIDKSMTERQSDIGSETTERAYSIEYEKQLIYAIKNGLVDKIDKLEFDSEIGKIGTSSPNNLRRIKNLILTLNSICLRAAIEGGVYEETAYNLGDVFSQMIESATSVASLRPTSALIKREYCKQVQSITMQKVEDPLVFRATKYIYANIHNKITAKEIAEHVGVTPQHLSARFAAATQTSIPDYILQLKIKEAKQLLRYTSKSLSEITFILSFSSQSYFQTQFKKVTGKTPLEYRNEKQRV